jgi:hypothetical protein
MDLVMASAKKYSPAVPQEKRLIRTIQAWGELWCSGKLKLADKAGFDRPE